MDWKDYIPREEHHLYEESSHDLNIDSQEIDTFGETDETIDSRVITEQESRTRKAKHSTALAICESGNVLNAYKLILNDFTKNNMPKSFEGKHETFYNAMISYYAEVFADNLLRNDALLESHENALKDTYIQVINLKDK